MTLEKSLKNLDVIFEKLSLKYGDKGAERIMSTKMMVHLISTDKSEDEIVKLAEKIAIFNGINQI